MQEFGFQQRVESMQNLSTIDPPGYLDFLKLMTKSTFVLTDSGGIQEETTILSVPCITLRENTERPITIKEGTNILVGTDTSRIVEASSNVLSHHVHTSNMPQLWDGHAAQRIVHDFTRKSFTITAADESGYILHNPLKTLMFRDVMSEH